MNPSYNSGSSASGGSNTPGVKPGVIASGPDSGDAPVPLQPLSAPAPSPMTVSRKTLFGRRSQSSGTQTFQPIQLSGGNAGGPKKGLIIAGLAVVVILIIGLFVGMMMGGGAGDGKNVAAFDELINYVTSGEESTESVDEEYSALDDYYFLDGWEDEEGKVAVYDKTKELLDNFVADYRDGDDAILNELIKSTKEQFDFMYLMSSKNKLDETDIKNRIIKNGVSATEKYIVDYYGLSDLDDSYTTGFMQACTNWIKALNTSIKDNTTTGPTVQMYYRNVNYYFNMDRNFVGNLYSINDLLNSNSTVEAKDEEEE